MNTNEKLYIKIAQIVQKHDSLNRYFKRIKNLFTIYLLSYVDYACGWNRKIMKLMGIWPDERRFTNASSYKVLFPIGFMFLFITLPQTTDLYFIWGDFELIVENLSVANMTTTIAILKAATFWSNGRCNYT
ncbi:odorant receptor 13a-like [Vespula squamosa]|uniref:Odorant receptor 13a-like n=1 Tax=Vespula squamosa TaxID=30214 RepID=A0ABD2A891_VESSQ